MKQKSSKNLEKHRNYFQKKKKEEKYAILHVILWLYYYYSMWDYTRDIV